MVAESKPIASTAIARLTYDPDTEECEFTFAKGGTYTITISEIEVERWINASSPGGYFNSFIRGNY